MKKLFLILMLIALPSTLIGCSNTNMGNKIVISRDDDKLSMIFKYKRWFRWQLFKCSIRDFK